MQFKNLSGETFNFVFQIVSIEKIMINNSYVYIKGKSDVNQTRIEDALNRKSLGSWLDGVGNAIVHGKREH